MKTKLSILCAVVLSFAVASCGGGGGGAVGTTFSLGGTVTGNVDNDPIVLKNNGRDNLTMNADGAFTFATAVADGAAYVITAETAPGEETCTVNNATGTMHGSDVATVTVQCAEDAFTVGGNVTGLSSGDKLTLQNNGSDNLLITGNGVFTFANPVAENAQYDVSVLSAPAGKICTVNNSKNSVAADVTDVSVICSSSSFTVSGTVTGITGSGTLVLQNNNANDQSLTTDGPFAFTTKVAVGAIYSVTASSTPLGKTCSILHGTGVITNGNITDVAVSCSTSTYTVGGTAAGLGAGEALVLQDNGADDLNVTSNDVFTFSTPVTYNTAYAVTVKTPPAGKTCTVNKGSGTIGTANVTDVTAICSAIPYTVSATVTGLLSGTLVLQNNGGDNLSITTNGTFPFATALADGAGYLVAVSSNPVGETCSVTGSSGTIASAGVVVAVNCSAISYTVGGAVTGLIGVGTLVLQDNGADNLSLTTNGSFTFATAVASGSPYNVSIFSLPTGRTCNVTSGSGTISGANIIDVAVACTPLPQVVAPTFSPFARIFV